MKKVLFIASQPFHQWRGSPIRVGFDVRAIAELGRQVDLLVLPVGEDKVIPGVRVIRTPNIFLAGNVPIGPSLLKAAFDAVLFCHGLILAIRNRYDVIHCVEDAGAIGIFIAGITRSKLVFEKHSDPASYKNGAFRNLVMWIYSHVERLMVRHADACIGTGRGLVEQMKAMNPRGTVHHIFDIPSSMVEATPSKVAGIRKKLTRKENEVLVGFVGSFAVYQGINLLFESIPEVVGKAPDVRFVIIGGTPEEIEQRKRRLAEEQAESAVTFTGKIPPDDLPDYLAALDILLSPRQAGVNSPLKILDYMKAGKAIVAHDTEAHKFLLDSATAVLVKPGPAAFSEGIVALVKDAALRDRLGKAGRKLIDEKYNYREFKRRLGVCYEALDENSR